MPAKINWKFAVDRALSSIRKGRQAVRTEWKKFSPEKVNVLLALTDPQTPDELSGSVLANAATMRDIFSSDVNFLTQCFLVCMDVREMFGKFHSLYSFVERSVDEGKMEPVVWQQVFPVLILRSLELDCPQVLSQLLVMAHDSRPPKLGSEDHPPPFNDPALIRACERDSYEMVRLLVDRGYRLRSSHLSRVRAAKKESTWRDYTDVPFLRESSAAIFSDDDDEVHDLHVLRTMTKPAYILACYTVASDGIDFDDPDRKPCECFLKEVSWTGGMQKKTSQSSILSMVNCLPDEFHHCPAHERFLPHPECRRHLECNDPVFRCFDLAKVSSEKADSVPEYRAEYAEIATSARGLSVQLLEQCQNTREVGTLLEESAGSEKYFRYAKFLKYPRMRMAIEHNHKDFAGHMFCQQMLRQEWHGEVDWHGKHFPYKVIYFVLQILLAPFYVAMAIFVAVGRDIKILRYGTLPPISSASGRLQRWYYRYLHYTNSVTVNLDAPINRYLTYTGYYLIFLELIMCVLRPVPTNVTTEYEFPWFHICLLIYAVSFLWHDFMCMVNLKSIVTFFKFWRVFDLILHFTLFFSLVLRLVMIYTYPCFDDEDGFVYCEASDVGPRSDMDAMSSCLFALSSTLAMIRLAYWFQLNDTIGPVIINLSRVMMDILTMMGIYMLVVLAFSCGFVFVLTADTYIPLEAVPVLTNDTANKAYAQNFTEIAATLFWSILQPGQSVLFETSGFRGTLSSLMFAMYQILCVIVFLNLLIATMNSTVQKIQDRKILYWKFTRASIWIEFFDAQASIPPPFSALGLVWFLCFLVVVTINAVVKHFQTGRVACNVHVPCKPGVEAQEKRKKHSLLMMQLIGRYLKKSKLSIVNDEVKKEDLEKLKKDVVNDVIQVMERKGFVRKF